MTSEGQQEIILRATGEERECYHAERLGAPVVIEMNAARPIGTGEHADEEKQQRRHSPSPRHFAGNDAEQQEPGRRKKNIFDRQCHGVIAVGAYALP